MQRVLTSLKHLALVFLALGCTPKERAVHLKVAVKTNQGEPVSAASISLDGKPLGESDNAGLFQRDVNLAAGARAKVEVRKESDTYYFAPFFQAFTVSEASPQEASIGATLYFVPKPAPTAAVTKAEPEKSAVSTKSAPAPLAKADIAEETVPNKAADLINDETTQSDDIAPGVATLGTSGPTPSPGVPRVAVQDPTPGNTETTAPPAAEGVKAETAEAVAVSSAEEPAVNLEATDTDIAKGPGYPQLVRTNQGSYVFTVHVLAGSSPLPDVEIALGEETSTQLKSACTTNQRGRCVVRFPQKPEAPVTFVATKKGFKTAVVTVSIKTKNKLRINLEQGHTFDIYALTESYSHVFGLPAVQVLVAGKKVGETDKFGHYTYVYSGKADDLVSISLKSEGYLPEVFETDFVAAGEMTLVKYFTPTEPPPARMAVLPPVAAGHVEPDTMQQIHGSFTQAVAAAARKTLFSSSAFKEYPEAAFTQAARRDNKTAGDLARQGWQDTDLKAVVDAVIVPTVVAGAQPLLELSVVDSKGRVLAAAKEELGSWGDSGALERAVQNISKKIVRVFPFEGSVLSKEGDKVIINLGRALGRGLKVGDQLDVYGLQTEKLGRSQLHGKIAVLTVRSVDDASAKASVSGLVARSQIERGDLVILRSRKAPEVGGAVLKVVAALGGSTTAVAQANVYLNDYWIGATDAGGRLYLDNKGSGTLKIIKQGFTDFTRSVALSSQAKIDVTLQRQAAFLKVDSKPTGAVVKIDGKVIGKTPLAAPVAVPTGFVKLELIAEDGFKPYSTVLELDQGELELVGDEAITLEPDFLVSAQKLRQSGKTAEALAILNSIPKEHSDYLRGRHEAGEIYLTSLDQPAKAAEAFGIVTANEAVKQFSDKRFIPSHIDEGVALFLTAERLAAEQPEAARAHYQKALEVLDNVVPYLRFVPAKEYPQAVHQVDYHRALCRHRLWVATQDPRLLADAVRTWRSYLEGSARSVPLDQTSKTYVENAEVYLKQAMASVNASRNVSRQ